MEIIIDRQTWYRGNGAALSRLLNSDNNRCCLGFGCGQIGVPDEHLFEKYTPIDIIQEFKELLKPFGMFDYDEGCAINNSKIIFNLIYINDCRIGNNFFIQYDGKSRNFELKSEEHREALIKFFFHKLNLDVKFIN